MIYRICGLKKSQVEEAKALLLEIVEEENRGSYTKTFIVDVEKTPETVEDREIPVFLDKDIYGGEDIYAVIAEKNSIDINLSAGQFDSFGWKSTPEEAWKAAKENCGDKLNVEKSTLMAHFYSGDEPIDGTYSVELVLGSMGVTENDPWRS